MNTAEISSKLLDAIGNYYRYNPDTLMPMLMAALAAEGNLKVGTTQTEGAEVLCKLDLNEILDYEWVQLNPKLRRMVRTALAAGSKAICVEGFIGDELKDIHQIFHHYDTVTVAEEYHYNTPSESAHRKYANIRMAEAMVAMPEGYMRRSFYMVANHMLQKSGLQPARPRVDVAHTLTWMLDYDGAGRVYNPFAGSGISAAMMRAGANMYADGNRNDKLFAVARLLSYGVSGTYENYRQRDSRQWIEGTFDYVMSTYRGYVDGQSAFDFCLSKCFDSLSEGGKFAGIVSPKEIFENQSTVFKEALKRDWIDTIILLPFAEVAVLVNTKKPKSLKSKVRFYDFTHPMLRKKSITYNLKNSCCEIVRVSDVRKKGYLRSLAVPEVTPAEGCELVTLSDYVKKLKRKTYSLARVPEDERVLATIDRKLTYNQLRDPWMQGIDKEPVTSIFSPVYHLKSHALIVNSRDNLEPRLFDADYGASFFEDGYAFEIIKPNNTDYDWLISQLNSFMVKLQLHPYGVDQLLPDSFTEEQILNLKLNRPIPGENEIRILGDASLDPGYVVRSGNMEYKIQKFLGNGFFGYTYIATQKNKTTGQKAKVVLKEFYPDQLCDRDGVRIVLTDVESADSLADCRRKFIEEAEIMKKLGNIEGSHIVPASSAFACEETDTLYYTMPYYDNGNLLDLLRTGYTFKEDMVIEKILKPLCRALHLAHKDKVLHLDIKPDNILLDDNGEVVLIDFGVAKRYDAEGNVVSQGIFNPKTMFSAPELAHGNMVKFGIPADVFGLAACIYYLMASPSRPTPVYEYSDIDKDLRLNLQMAHCNDKFADAIIAGLQAVAAARPADIQTFLNLFPGCEGVRLF